MGYEPDGPREEIVYPGQETTVKIMILIPRRRNNDAAQLFNEGLEYYNKGSRDNYLKAADRFQKALVLDSKYSTAALFLARTHNALYDQAKAKEYFRKAIEIDPDYVEARASFGGMLLDIGDVDSAIRELNAVIQKEPKQALAHYLLAQSFSMKGAYQESIEFALRAIELTPANGEAWFWLAESLRMSKSYEEAKTAYLNYLRLSDFDSKLAGKLNYYVVGFLVGKGKKKRAAQHDIWEDLRSLAYFGLCDCDRLLGSYGTAINYCQRSLAYDKNDPIAHFVLGMAYARQADAAGSDEPLGAALKHFLALLKINPDIEEAAHARTNIAAIQAYLSSTK
jgi:tetratricopeptide (TPR) repeat protein